MDTQQSYIGKQGNSTENINHNSAIWSRLAQEGDILYNTETAQDIYQTSGSKYAK